MGEWDLRKRRLVSILLRTEPSTAQRLQQTVEGLARQDPALDFETPAEGEGFVIYGPDELYLKAVCQRIQNESAVNLDIGSTRVVYLETIRKEAEAEGKYIRRRQYAHTKIRLEPGPRGSGYHFAKEVESGALPPEFVRAVDSGIQKAAEGGVLRGHSVVDFQAVLYDASYHEQDSNEMTFEIAASLAFKEAARKASPVILEPVMLLEIRVPRECIGWVEEDVIARRGRINEIQDAGTSTIVSAFVVMAELLGYGTELHAVTKGRAEYSIGFARYEEISSDDASGEGKSGVAVRLPQGPTAGSGSASVLPENE